MGVTWDVIDEPREAAKPEHVHGFDLMCWRCDTRTECKCGLCSKCGEAMSGRDLQDEMDEADRKRARRIRQ